MSANTFKFLKISTKADWAFAEMLSKSLYYIFILLLSFWSSKYIDKNFPTSLDTLYKLEYYQIGLILVHAVFIYISLILLTFVSDKWLVISITRPLAYLIQYNYPLSYLFKNKRKKLKEDLVKNLRDKKRFEINPFKKKILTFTRFYAKLLIVSWLFVFLVINKNYPHFSTELMYRYVTIGTVVFVLLSSITNIFEDERHHIKKLRRIIESKYYSIVYPILSIILITATIVIFFYVGIN